MDLKISQYVWKGRVFLMDISCLEKFVSEYKFGDSAGITEILLLNGCLAMYEKTGKEFFKKTIEEKFENYVSGDGELKVSADTGVYIFETGKCLIFLDREGINEKYNKALLKLYNKLRALKREDGIFVYSSCTECNSHSAEDIMLDTLTHVLPFYMSYETIYNKKGNYNDIVAQARQLYDVKFDEKTNKYSQCIIAEAKYLNALADTTLAVAEEIYEHFNFFKCLLREAVQGIIPYLDKTNVFLGSDNTERMASTALILAAVKKGCKSGALLSEKYEEFISKVDKAVCDGSLHYKDDAVTMAAFMQAYV